MWGSLIVHPVGPQKYISHESYMTSRLDRSEQIGTAGSSVYPHLNELNLWAVNDEVKDDLIEMIFC